MPDKQGRVRYFVPGLPEWVGDSELRSHFSQFGGKLVDVAVVKDKGTGASRGFGYVEMADTSNQEVLLSATHEFGGKAVSIMLTKDSLAGFELHKVHLGRLPLDVTAEAIRETFSRFGVVLDVHLPKDNRTGDRKNFGFVTYGTEEASSAALAARRVDLCGFEIPVSPAVNTKQADSIREVPLNATGVVVTRPLDSPGGIVISRPFESTGTGSDAISNSGNASTKGQKPWGGCSTGPDWGCWSAKSGLADPGCWAGEKGEPADAAGCWGAKGTSLDPGAQGDSFARYFIPGLPENVTDEELRTHFGRYGTVLDVAVVKDKSTDKSRGFGYVTMQDAASREQILTDRHEFDGRSVPVMLTKDSLAGTDVKKVHLGKLDPRINAEAIRDAFSMFGTILDVHTPKDPRTGERKNFGFVTFSSEEAYHAAVTVGRATVQDCEVTIKPAAQCKELPMGGASGPFGWDDASVGNGSEAWSWGRQLPGERWHPYGMWCGGKACMHGPTRDMSSGSGENLALGNIESSGACSSAPSRPKGVKYFITGLPDSVGDGELRSYFSEYGAVLDGAIVKDKKVDRSRGFGYITMVDSSSQESMLNGKHLFGNKLVSVMLTKESLATVDIKKVHLGKLSPDISAESIKEAFSRFGVVLDVHTPKDPTTGERKGYGFVSFGSDDAFNSAVTSGQIRIGQCDITIKPAAQMKESGEDVSMGCRGFDRHWGMGCFGDTGWDDSWWSCGQGGSWGSSWKGGPNNGWDSIPDDWIMASHDMNKWSSDAWSGDMWVGGGANACWGGSPWGKGGDMWGYGGGKGGCHFLPSGGRADSWSGAGAVDAFSAAKGGKCGSMMFGSCTTLGHNGTSGLIGNCTWGPGDGLQWAGGTGACCMGRGLGCGSYGSTEQLALPAPVGFGAQRAQQVDHCRFSPY